MEVARGWDRGEWKLAFNEDKVSVLQAENVLDGSDSCTTVYLVSWN